MLDPDRNPSAEVLAALPIFPLPNVVFLPGMVLPLNVFEPRYLELVDHVLEGGHHIGVPLLRRASGVPDDAPDFERVFGIGHLVAHTKLSDGRRFIRLDGIGRVRALEELPRRHLYREVRAELLEESVPKNEEAFEILKAQVERMARTFDDDDEAMVRSILQFEDPRVILYAITSLVPNVDPALSVFPPEAGGECPQLRLQQRCLDADDADDRVRILLDRAGTLIDHLGESGRFPAFMIN